MESIMTNQSSSNLPVLSPVPTQRNMISYVLRSEGESPRKQWTMVVQYPDCERSFDGKTWKVTADYRECPLENNCFDRNVLYPV